MARRSPSTLSFIKLSTRGGEERSLGEQVISLPGGRVLTGVRKLARCWFAGGFQSLTIRADV